jgi:hypothetical protein
METLLIAAALTSFAACAVMAVFAWIVVRQNHRREAARVELLSSLAFPDGVPIAAMSDRVEIDPGSDEFLSERPAANEALFREAPKSDVGSRRTIALAAVCVVMTLVVSTLVAFVRAPAKQAPTQAAPAAVTLLEPRVELLALDHATTSAGLVVTGRLRNPAGAASLHDVVAVVDVLDRSGRVLTTASAPIARPILNAGEWSDFSVAASKTREIARYRVEFHAKEREPVPQIDLRSNSRSE